MSSQWDESVGRTCLTYLSNINIFFMKVVQVFLSSWWKRTPFMKEIHRTLKFTNLESSTFVKKKSFCVRPTDFSLLRVILTLLNFLRFYTNLKIYSGKPDISFMFNSDKSIISKRENLKTKESYVRQISNRIRANYYRTKEIYIAK